MYTMLTIFIFMAILFVYIHVQHQWKTSDDLEIYETDYESPKQMQEIVSVKQPVLFQINQSDAKKWVNRTQLRKFEKYDNLDVNVKETADYYNVSKDADIAVDFVSLPLRSASTLLSSDSNGKYFSENNGAFIEESGLEGSFQVMDDFLKPPLTAYTKYDVLFGSQHACTPLRYHTMSQQYLCVTGGKIRVKMCPPKYRKVLPLVKDYENYEFRTSVDAWSSDSGKRGSEGNKHPILDKIKFLDFEVHAGTTLYVPPYWWYSLKFSKDTTVAALQYDQIMNLFAQSNEWFFYFLQQSNISPKLTSAKLVSLDSPSVPDEDSDEEENDEDKPVLSRPPSRATLEVDNAPKEIATNAGTYVVSGM